MAEKKPTKGEAGSGSEEQGKKNPADRKVPIGQDVVKSLSEWAAPTIAKAIMSRIPRAWDDDLAKLLGPLTSVALLRLIPDDKRWSQAAEDLVAATVRDAQRLLKSGELVDKEPSKAAEALGLDVKRISGEVMESLDAIDAFAERLTEDERAALFRFLNTANASAISAWLRMNDAEKLIRVQAMIRLAEKPAPSLKSAHFSEHLRKADPAQQAGFWAWYGRLAVAERTVVDRLLNRKVEPAFVMALLALPEAERIDYIRRTDSGVGSMLASTADEVIGGLGDLASWFDNH